MIDMADKHTGESLRLCLEIGSEAKKLETFLMHFVNPNLMFQISTRDSVAQSTLKK